MAPTAGALAARDDPELARIALIERAAGLLHGGGDLIADGQPIAGGACAFAEHSQNSDLAAAAAELKSGAGTIESAKTKSAETSSTNRTLKALRSKAGRASSK